MLLLAEHVDVELGGVGAGKRDVVGFQYLVLNSRKQDFINCYCTANPNTFPTSVTLAVTLLLTNRNQRTLCWRRKRSHTKTSTRPQRRSSASCSTRSPTDCCLT